VPAGNAYPGGWDPRLPFPGWAAGAPRLTGTGRFRAMSIPELIDGAFTLYRRNFLLIVAIAAVIQVPFAAVDYLLYRVIDVGGRLDDVNALTRQIENQGNVATTTQRDALVGDFVALLAYVAVLFAIQFLVVRPLSQAATVTAVSERYLERPASLGRSYAAALARWRPLLAMVLIQVGLLVLGAGVVVLLLVIAGSDAVALPILLGVGLLIVAIVVAVRWSLGAQVVVVERTSGFGGLKRSWTLTRSRFWRTVWFMVLLWLITIVAALIISLVFTLPFSGAGNNVRQAVSQVGGTLANVFVVPLTLIAVTLYYYDLRIRREAFDLEMLAATL